MKTKYVKPQIVISVEGDMIIQTAGNNNDTNGDFVWPEDGVLGWESGNTPGILPDD